MMIGIVLDKNGWTSTSILIEKLNQKGFQIDLDTLKHVVESNSKKRFAFKDAFDQIRANQGHSVEVDLGYQAQRPPHKLYHGTAEQFVKSILKTGLEKRRRHHVHLSADTETALNVGKRHGKPFIFEIQAAEMYQDKFAFFLSENGVWLTDHVPAKYLKQLDQ
jgi:putative RNA 2'-phosphotransferase